MATVSGNDGPSNISIGFGLFSYDNAVRFGQRAVLSVRPLNLCPAFDRSSFIMCAILQLQVSAGQHMQLTADLKPGVSVAAQQGMYFNQQQAQNQTGPSGQQTDTYCSVSQSQTINFTQQTIRQRAAAAAAGGVPQPGGGGTGARGHPQQVPPAQVDQHHAKLLQQQQQMLRAQQVSHTIYRINNIAELHLDQFIRN